MSSVIRRAKNPRIQREETPKDIRKDSEVQAAYEQVGELPQRNTRSWYRDIYDFYQNNEC